MIPQGLRYYRRWVYLQGQRLPVFMVRPPSADRWAIFIRADGRKLFVSYVRAILGEAPVTLEEAHETADPSWTRIGGRQYCVGIDC